jgi:hypothetical protein
MLARPRVAAMLAAGRGGQQVDQLGSASRLVVRDRSGMPSVVERVAAVLEPERNWSQVPVSRRSLGYEQCDVRLQRLWRIAATL